MLAEGLVNILTKTQNITSELKSFCRINILGKTSNWEGWPDTFLVRFNRRGIKKLLTRKDTVPASEEYKKVLADKSGDDIVTFNDASEEAFEDCILSIDLAPQQRKNAFGQVNSHQDIAPCMAQVSNGFFERRSLRWGWPM